jgi:hypothetical protein
MAFFYFSITRAKFSKSRSPPPPVERFVLGVKNANGVHLGSALAFFPALGAWRYFDGEAADLLALDRALIPRVGDNQYALPFFGVGVTDVDTRISLPCGLAEALEKKDGPLVWKIRPINRGSVELVASGLRNEYIGKAAASDFQAMLSKHPNVVVSDEASERPAIVVLD